MTADLDLIRERSIQKICNLFDAYIEKNSKNRDIENCSVVIYAIMKTQGEIMNELRDFPRAITVWKALQSCCQYWNSKPLEIWSLISLATSYKVFQDYDQAISALEQALSLAIEIEDYDIEITIYEHLAICHYYKRDIDKAQFYHDKLINCQRSTTSATVPLNEKKLRYVKRKRLQLSERERKKLKQSYTVAAVSNNYERS